MVSIGLNDVLRAVMSRSGVQIGEVPDFLRLRRHDADDDEDDIDKVGDDGAGAYAGEGSSLDLRGLTRARKLRVRGEGMPAIRDKRSARIREGEGPLILRFG